MSKTFNNKLPKGLKEAFIAVIFSSFKVVNIDEEEREDYPECPDQWVSTYGWADYDATEHIKEECSLIFPKGVEISEIVYSEFQGTFAGNLEVSGVNAYGGPEGSVNEIRCACDAYRGLTLRNEQALGEIIKKICQ